jgi:isopentenyl-diphosphate delta-isomerase
MSDMPELWQGCDEQGRFTGPVTRKQAAEGALHVSAHLWIWRHVKGEVEVLLQKRAAVKRTWPNFYDISAAGHVDYQEDPLAAAIRETQEEIGLTISAAEITELFKLRGNVKDETSGIIENEVRYVYGLIIKDMPQFSLDTVEVSELQWVSLTDFKQATQGKGSIKLVPQGDGYFEQLIEAIQKR